MDTLAATTWTNWWFLVQPQQQGIPHQSDHNNKEKGDYNSNTTTATTTSDSLLLAQDTSILSVSTAAATAGGSGPVSSSNPCGSYSPCFKKNTNNEEQDGPSPPTNTNTTTTWWWNNLWSSIMGACMSAAGSTTMLVDQPDGTEEDYHARYIEDRVLGEGEFGVVKLVHDMKAGNDNNLACKTLRKGMVFKDNTLYTAIKPQVLLCEVNIMRKLAGKHYCLKMHGIYETPKAIYMVLEYCAGGEMMDYIAKQAEDLRTDDVSRISFQLLDAVHHCAVHNVIHRDIKPENIMFQSPAPGSDLRLIDFGSGTDQIVENGTHTTFAGSAFYMSPEMFQRTYTTKTDVWSAGVVLYVVTAGYPANVLQKAFNLLQTSDTKRKLRDLPNMPTDLPDSYFDLLEGLLVYRHKKRKSAGDMLTQEFVQFHKQAFSVDSIAAAAATTTTTPSSRRTQSISLRGSVSRHTLFLDYQKYERSLTTLLATLLDKKDLQALLHAIDFKMEQAKQQQQRKEEQAKNKAGDDDEDDFDEDDIILPLPNFQKQLDVLQVNELKVLLEEQDQAQVISMMDKLPNASGYNTFAYHVNLLKEFLPDQDGNVHASSVRGRNRSNSFSKGNNNSSIRSLGGSIRGMRRNSSRNNQNNSLRGTSSNNKPIHVSMHGRTNPNNNNNTAAPNSPLGRKKGRSASVPNLAV